MFFKLEQKSESVFFWRREHELLCLSENKVWGVVFELLLSAPLLGALITALCKVMSPVPGAWAGVGSLAVPACEGCGWLGDGQKGLQGPCHHRVLSCV